MWGIIVIAGFIGLALFHGSLQGIWLGLSFRKVTKYPDEAYAWFRSHDDWLVFETTDTQYIANKLPQAKLLGPIRFVVPILGQKEITVYGLIPHAEASWHEFEKNLKKEKN